MLNRALLAGMAGICISVSAWGINVTAIKTIDPEGADTINYENPNTWQATTIGKTVGAAKISKLAFEALPASKMGVLDFETANGWTQNSLPIRYDQDISGQGSPFDRNRGNISPYSSSDRLTTVSTTGMKGSDGEDLTISFDSVLRDTQVTTTTEMGVFLTTDNGDGSTGYLVTSGTQGISTPSLYWTGSSNIIEGVLVTFSSPMQAMGVCTNMGQPSYGRYPKVIWFDSDGNQLAVASSPCNVGNSIFWGIQTNTPAIKSMWIGDNESFPGNYIIDDIAFSLTVPEIIPGDANYDGKVDVGDLGILAANYGTNASGAEFDADYAKVFGKMAANDTADNTAETDDSLCSGLGISLIIGLSLMGLMIVKLEE